MDAVRHIADRDLVGVERGPQPVEHLAAHLAVQPGDAVGPLREAQAHDRHVEHARVAAVVRLGAERQDRVDRDRGHRVVAAEVLLDELAREPVDPGRHRRVRREHRPGPDDLHGGVEPEPLVGQLADPLEPEEAGVPLVGVEHLG